MRRILALVFCSLATAGWAQIGGHQAFDFLNVPAHARLAGMGGVNVSLADRDLNFFHSNPSLAGDTLGGAVSAGYQFYVGDVGNALFSYAHDLGGHGQLLAGIQHTNYGSLQGYDESGLETLEYASSETSLVAGKTNEIGNFRVGATLKAVFSNIAGYRATGIMLDLGGIFSHPTRELTIGLALKNMGFVFREYSKTSTSELPFDVQAGITMKPEYMPLRFSITGYHLTKGRLLYDPLGERTSTLKNVLSHLNLGAEILLHRNADILVGYNYLLHQTLLSETAGSGAGLSYGFSLFVKPVEFVFSRSAYTVGNAGYSFSLLTNTNHILKRRK